MMMMTGLMMTPRIDAARAAEVTIRADDEGFGAMKAPSNALVLVSYVGTIVESGEMFDTTYGGERFDTNAAGVGSRSSENSGSRLN